jgi:hypothetical protein
MKMKCHPVFLLILNMVAISSQAQTTSFGPGHQVVVDLYREWRVFEKPPLVDGAPDYRAEIFDKRLPKFRALQKKLLSLDTTGWPIEQQVDWNIIRAEMNGFDFNYRVLKPWARDPAFYKSIWTERSDVPAHEGPTHHLTTELWTYSFPLSRDVKTKLINDLKVIPPLNKQAMSNLTGNARELWIAGTNDIRMQSTDLRDLLQKPGVKGDMELAKAINEAITSTNILADWLDKQAPSKTGPSGIGKENYTWYQQNVNLLPLTWDDEVLLLKRELARAWSSLKLEEQHNRNLPPLTDVKNPEEYKARAEASVHNLMDFLKKKEILTVKDYFEPAVMEHIGSFVSADRRNFFLITSHIDPRPLFSHFYHWFELSSMDNEPHPCEVRKGPLLYNIFAARNEGLATAVEEIFMQAGLYDDSPRSREIVYIMLANRAARGLGSLYAQANLMTMADAGFVHKEYTPRGWMKVEKKLAAFEQQLYLRLPGYGTSYITGKYQIEETMADYAKQKESKGELFSIKKFLDSINTMGCIPVSLSHQELTGRKDF